MMERILMRIDQARDALAAGGLKTLLAKRVYFGQEEVPVEMDLTGPPWGGDQLEKAGCRFVELGPGDVGPGGIPFVVASRGHKGSVFLRRGWRGFALVQDGKVVGDVWCVTRPQGAPRLSHPDLRMLKIDCGEGEAYAFDMLIDPSSRGKNLAVPFQKALQDLLRREGFRKVYGCYRKSNLPALWMHRMLKFRELPALRVSRFFCFHSSTRKR